MISPPTDNFQASNSPSDHVQLSIGPIDHVRLSRSPAIHLRSRSGDFEYALAPYNIIERMVHAWFELFYPLCPLLHRATFYRQFSAAEMARSREFAALVDSICAATIGNLKRGSFASAEFDEDICGGVTVEQCLAHMETLGFFNQRVRRPTLERCQSLYNLSIAQHHVRGMDDAEVFHFLGESITGTKYLLYHDFPNMSRFQQEMLKRLYWLLFAAQW